MPEIVNSNCIVIVIAIVTAGCLFLFACLYQIFGKQLVDWFLSKLTKQLPSNFRSINISLPQCITGSTGHLTAEGILNESEHLYRSRNTKFKSLTAFQRSDKIRWKGGEVIVFVSSNDRNMYSACDLN
ncbi:hypothetical protein PHYBLDRAFT_62670 [Phycomyces blakesleeanus NRRL 1555(-)]|uniref:Uncharacterized protein n=1 Tax=Phycomyces blakesleeanus (strain ATCC 8743b / DSM 1359 / FGSC 10004 / NBRC 33097 / NRRL 1555) TaxID=763407 RepID=A0A167PUN5_PHYB8|nr:hypothetical protein PHYBLDRAFT_62670 [Phycomyces blakesleeanus NRRL 1555(-)]OAD78566.1 hypothetical protein PHYBLDRAFT_62670 [Phycomyces blakesleeanus NRRL 1555(-)]|eukprot:XP_018296606.1 hypothetical protein PHYBLDRAFT_62670 [Phycomyces blakesleeanus NRRL 1555(-)]